MANYDYSLRRTFGLIFFAVIYIGTILMFFVNGQAILSLLIALAPFAMKLVVNRKQLFYLCLLSSVALFGVPGIRFSSVSLGFMLQIIVLAAFVQDVLIKHKKIPKADLIDWLTIIFILNLLFTASVRGFGLYRFGGNMIGGVAYIQVLIGFIFFIFLRDQQISRSRIERLFLQLVSFSAIPFLMQFVISRIPGLYSLSNFFVFNKRRVLVAIEQLDAASGRGGRYESVVNLAYLLICLGTIWAAEKKYRGLLFSLLGISLMLLSGFRRYAILSALVFVVSSILLSRHRVRTALIMSLIAILSLSQIYAFAPSLPYNMQRAASILPGITVGEEAYKSGAGSSEWRMDIYKLCWEEVPDFLLLGKGFLVSVQDKIAHFAYYSLHGFDANYAVMTHSYHNGFFELMLDVGLIGFLAFLMICVIQLSKAYKHIKRHNDGSRIWRIITTFWVVCICMLVDYLFVRGEFVNFISAFLLFFGTLILALKAHQEELKLKSAEGRFILTSV